MHSYKSTTLLFSTVLVLASSASLVRADDGRLEINQACALVGCFPGDTAGFPVQIAERGSYLLTSNITPASGASGVVTAVDGVRIDLNGFEVRGPGSCSATLDGNRRPIAVTCTGAAGIGLDGPSDVRNGTIRGFLTGIEMPAGESLHFSNVTLAESGTGIDGSGSGLILTDSVIRLHSFSGVSGQDPESRFTVRGCLFERNTQGIYLANGIATENVFYQNREGLRSNLGTQPMVTNNGFTSNVSSISGADAAFQGNAFHNNTNNPGGTNLGNNVCSGALCP